MINFYMVMKVNKMLSSQCNDATVLFWFIVGVILGTLARKTKK